MTAVRVMMVSWWIYCITLGAVYSGNLVAFIAVTDDDIPFRTMEDVAASQGYTIGTLGASVYEMQFRVSGKGNITGYHMLNTLKCRP